MFNKPNRAKLEAGRDRQLSQKNYLLGLSAQQARTDRKSPQYQELEQEIRETHARLEAERDAEERLVAEWERGR